VKNLKYSVTDLNRFGDDLVDYIDAFSPHAALPLEWTQMAGTKIIPPLVSALDKDGLRPGIGHDLRTVEKLYRTSGGRMKRLIQTNDPSYHPHASPDDTMVLAILRDGKPQGCVVSRLLWCERSLAEEMETGRLWVSHPSFWTSEDRCIVRAPIAKRISACYVVFTGSIYLAQEVTGGTTLAAMLRLHYLWLVCHWRFSWLTGIIEGALARRHIFDVYGMTGLDVGLWRTRPGEGSELHKYELPTCDRETAMSSWLRPETGDLSRPLGWPPISVVPKQQLSLEAH
jgi:hypothetical protein